MENFETNLNLAQKFSNLGIFDKENIEEKLKKLEKTTNNENFWRDQNLVKNCKTKNFLKIF